MRLKTPSTTLITITRTSTSTLAPEANRCLRKSPARPRYLSPLRGDEFYESQNEYGPSRNYKVADRSNHRCENVIQHRILEVSRINRSRFGPADHRGVKKHGNCGQQKRSNRINMFDGIERNPPQHACGRIATQVGHPGVRRFVDADREQERDQLEHYVDVLQGHARLVSILTRGAAIPGVSSALQSAGVTISRGTSATLRARLILS